MSLCRINAVKSARQSPGKCQKCGITIDAGQPYFWWKGRYTGKYVRCIDHPPQPGETETNPLKADAYEAERKISDAQSADTAGEAVAYLEEAIALVEGINEELYSRVSNMESTALAQTEQFQTLQNTQQEFDDWRSNADSWLSDLSSMDPDPPEDDDPDSQEAYASELEAYLLAIEDLPELDLGAYGPPPPKRKRKPLATDTSFETFKQERGL